MKSYPKKLKTLLKTEIDPAFTRRAELIFIETENSQPQSVLDLGCGRGFYLKALTFFPKIKEIVGVDVNQSYLDVAKTNINDKRVSLKKMDINQLTKLKKKFDLIILTEVLEHIPDDQELLLKIKKILKPKGRLIITVPNSNFPFCWDPLNYLLMRLFNTHINKDIWWLAGIWADHERLYSAKQLKQLINRTGYRILKNEPIVRYCWPFSHFLLYGLGKNLVEKLSLKGFDRFNFEQEKNTGRLLAKLMAWPNKQMRKIFNEKSSVSANHFLLLANK
ncbi:MAG: class I SAM-dependent methyltransferase [Patescibacteria group bacterium]|nr:class I SAM-dependent methyltransferase [Patescibacteria group bacterium]